MASGAYRKEMLTVEVDGRDRRCLVYVDPVEEEGKPREEYVERLNKGIVDAQLPPAYVELYLREFIPSRLPLR